MIVTPAREIWRAAGRPIRSRARHVGDASRLNVHTGPALIGRVGCRRWTETFLFRNQELIALAGPKRQAAPLLADDFAGDGELEEAMAKAGVDFREEPTDCAITHGDQGLVISYTSFLGHRVHAERRGSVRISINKPHSATSIEPTRASHLMKIVPVRDVR